MNGQENKQIKAQMVLLGIANLRVLSKESGVSPYRLQRIISGDQEPRLSDMIGISTALNSEPEIFWPELADTQKADIKVNESDICKTATAPGNDDLSPGKGVTSPKPAEAVSGASSAKKGI